MNIDNRINHLKSNFIEIADVRTNVIAIMNVLELKIGTLKTMYADFIHSNKDGMFVFSLDSFQFQSKIIDIEYDDIIRIFCAINNRMYCEYYKLYRIISAYILEAVQDKKMLSMIQINNNYPIYKDLEPYKDYDFNTTQDIHENIVVLLNTIYGYVLHKEHDLKSFEGKRDSGLSLDNFINTFNYTIVLIREKLLLFIEYMDFFHKLHAKYIRRFMSRVQLMFSQISHDIKFDDSVEMNKSKKESMMNAFENDEIDQELMNHLKQSLDSIEGSIHGNTLSVNLIVDILDQSANKDTIENKNEDDDDDAISEITNEIATIATIADISNNNCEATVEPKKRKYKPRKKKEQPLPSNE